MFNFKIYSHKEIKLLKKKHKMIKDVRHWNIYFENIDIAIKWEVKVTDITGFNEIYTKRFDI